MIVLFIDNDSSIVSVLRIINYFNYYPNDNFVRINHFNVFLFNSMFLFNYFVVFKIFNLCINDVYIY